MHRVPTTTMEGMASLLRASRARAAKNTVHLTERKDQVERQCLTFPGIILVCGLILIVWALVWYVVCESGM